MEEQDPIAQDDPSICANCNIEPILEGHPTRLCGNCRNYFIKFPIPKWIYAFGGGVLVIMLISMVQMPKYMDAAMDYGRAEKAMDKHNYVTAQKNLEQVLRKVPSFKEAKANLLIAACYNKDMNKVSELFASLQQQTFEADLLTRMNRAVEFISAMIPNDSTIAERLDLAAKDSTAGLERLFNQIDTGYSNEKTILEYLVADRLYDQGNYEGCKKMLLHILSKEPNSYAAKQLMASVHRNLKNYDEAIADCNELLEINNEDVNAIAQKAKIELKRKNDKAAAVYAEQAYQIDHNSLGALEAKALLAYFAGNKAEGDKLLGALKAAETDSEQVVYNRTLAIFNGTESFR